MLRKNIFLKNGLRGPPYSILKPARQKEHQFFGVLARELFDVATYESRGLVNQPYAGSACSTVPQYRKSGTSCRPFCGWSCPVFPDDVGLYTRHTDKGRTHNTGDDMITDEVDMERRQHYPQLGADPGENLVPPVPGGLHPPPGPCARLPS